MCGIAGIVNFDGQPVDSRRLELMGAAISHRGRDGSGVYCDGAIGLTHQRLAIVDLSPGGAQPRVFNGGEIALVFNGEIVNYVELREELERTGVTFTSSSDTEVLLHVYRAFGVEGIKRLRGFFAFALVDQHRKVLVMARDIFGIKPLYILKTKSSLAFSSEVKTFVHGGLYRPRLDARGLQDYLYTQVYTPGRTLFEGVEQLPPAHVTQYDLLTGNERRQAYWACPSVSVDLAYDAWLEELDKRLKRAVATWMRADVPIGSYVSGGLDSSLVATLAAQQLRTPLQDRLMTFSSVFPGMRTPDEHQWSDAVAGNIGSAHHRIAMELDEIVRDHEEHMHVLDMPIAGYSAPYRTLSRHVRRHVKVVLTGHGGDETAAGYPKYIAAALVSQINAAYRTGSAIEFGSALRFLTGFEDQARRILSAGSLRDDKALVAAIFDRSSFLWDAVQPDLRNTCTGYRTSEQIASLLKSSADERPIQKILKIDRDLLLPALLHVEDRTSMIENLESRTPLLDQDVVEWLAVAPDHYLLKSGLKSPYRDLGRRHLPSAVIDNPRKSGVVYPVFEHVDTHLRDLIESDLDALDRSKLFTRPVRGFLKADGGFADVRILWALWSLGGWIRAFAPAI
jgi:asparagine synthase (glutamine-hydrolysing)